MREEHALRAGSFLRALMLGYRFEHRLPKSYSSLVYQRDGFIVGTLDDFCSYVPTHELIKMAERLTDEEWGEIQDYLLENS